MPRSSEPYIRLSSTEPNDILTEISASLSDGDRIRAIKNIVSIVQTGPIEGVNNRIAELCGILEQNPDAASQLGEALIGALTDLRVGPALINSSNLITTGFLSELKTRLTQRLLPEVLEEQDLRSVIGQVFHGRDDHLRISSVPEASWTRFLVALGIGGGASLTVNNELATAIRTLTAYAVSLGLHPQLAERSSPGNTGDSAFLTLPEHILSYLDARTNSAGEVETELLSVALDQIVRCESEVSRVRGTMNTLGTSLALTSMTSRLQRLLKRLAALLQLTDHRTDRIHAGISYLLREIVVSEKTRNHILPHIRSHVDQLAYQVVEHAANKGGKYITTGRRDYLRFFMASLGGGAIVAVFSFFKILLGKLDAPVGIEAALYGINYATCFVLIYVSGAALATKQPAMTANTLAQALGERKDRHLEHLEELVVRVWRSQFVSFAGNLLMAFPIAFAVSELFYWSSGETVTSPDSANAILASLHPWQSGTLFFAIIAGIFLFLSGLVSGWVDNRMVFTRVHHRIARQKVLIRLLGPSRSASAANFLHRHLGAMTGNVFLGFALGSTGTIGIIFGLPLDIRHIAFASAEMGTAIEILDFSLALSVLWPVVLGILLIGLLNFMISFGLSLATAMDARQITWSELQIFSRHLVRSFFQRPLEWFFPPAQVKR